MDKLQGRSIFMCKGSREYSLHNGTVSLSCDGFIVGHEIDHQIWDIGPTPYGSHIYYDDPAELMKVLLELCSENKIDTIRLETYEGVFTTKSTRKIEPVQIDTYHLSLEPTSYKASDEKIVRNVVDKFLA